MPARSVLLLLGLVGCSAEGRLSSDPARARDFDWVEEVVASARIHRADPAAAPDLGPRIAEARSRAASLLGVDDTAPLPDVYVVSSREEARRLTGFDVIGLTIDRHNAIVVLDSLPLLERSVRHEVGHWMSRRLLPRPSRMRPWVDEGIASLAAGGCGGRSWTEVAAHLLREDRLPGLAEIATLPVMGGSFPAYVGSAALLEWASERAGPGVLRAAWRDGMSGVQRELGLAIEEIDAAWRAELRGRSGGSETSASTVRPDSLAADTIPDRCS